MGPAGAAPDSQADRCEAARYALLRRLAPSMRHNLVVNLQPIGMIYEVLDRRLRAPQPDIAHVHDSARKIRGFARAALDSCLDVVTWLAPDEAAVTGAWEGTRECTALLATSLSFRGYTLRPLPGPVPGEVRRSAMRNVLTAALIQLTDELPPPAEVAITARPAAGGLEVGLRLRPLEGEGGIESAPGYRCLSWTDVQALAADEGVEVARPVAGEVVITFPWHRPARA